jgi:pyruvate dehydrogenase E1 component
MKSASPTAIESAVQGKRRDIYDLKMLDRIQRRVLWLSTYMVHHANFLRPNPDGIKVGGHEASSASVVTLMTALYFYFLRLGDLVSIKPHASPVFHAIQFLRGILPQEKLKTFRQYGGLQAYPSRTKDPDGVDFSTGSVGLGAVAPIFGALVRDYLLDHFGGEGSGPTGSSLTGSGWHIALVGDAELDEGNVWEALGEEYIQRLSRVLWIVDLNRQSLDRVVPDGRAQRLREMFRANGWRIIDLKYGKKLEEVFRRPYGLKVRAQIDEMSNEEYQSLLLQDGETIRDRLISHGGREDEAMVELLDGYEPDEVKELLTNLGGHDLESVLEAYEEAFAIEKQPVVIFAYTIKGWGLPFAGNPANHARLLKPEEIENLRQSLGIPAGEEFSAFPPKSEEARYISKRLEEGGWKSRQETVSPPRQIDIPTSLGGTYQGMLSTQAILGRIFLTLSRQPQVAPYLTTVSPDVAMSTNLGGWIHKVGVYSRRQMKNYFREQGISLLIDWRESPEGNHIELGISENNLFILLAMLGLADELYGQPLLPVGTVYDPFVCRALDAFTYAAYSQARFIVVGTPSGVSLSPEGGAHQSIITPGIGVQLPGVTYYEPAFALELEWILLAALRKLRDRHKGRSAYLRLSTKPVDQDLFNTRLAERTEEELRQQVLKGSYRLVDWREEEGYRPGETVVHLFVSGVMVSEAVAAARQLRTQGIFANVFNVTSADLLFHDYLTAQKEKMRGQERSCWVEELVSPNERKAPVVTVQDAHPHTLSFIGGVLSTRMMNLGVTEFGQSGSQADLYRTYGIATENIVEAAQWIVRTRR